MQLYEAPAADILLFSTVDTIFESEDNDVPFGETGENGGNW